MLDESNVREKENTTMSLMPSTKFTGSTEKTLNVQAQQVE